MHGFVLPCGCKSLGACIASCCYVAAQISVHALFHLAVWLQHPHCMHGVILCYEDANSRCMHNTMLPFDCGTLIAYTVLSYVVFAHTLVCLHILHICTCGMV